MCGCISELHAINRRRRPDLSVLTLLPLSVFFASSFSVCICPSSCPIYTHFSLLAYLLSLTTDIQKKQPGEDCTSKPIQSTGSSQSPVFSSDTSSSSSQSLLSSPPSSSEQPSTEEPSPTFPSTREGKDGQPVISTLMKNEPSLLYVFKSIRKVESEVEQDKQEVKLRTD